jgi:predicted N-formylglutamate amidohydrolase
LLKESPLSEVTRQFVISCEHARNLVPPQFLPHFEGKQELLLSHQGYDPGALEIAAQLAKALDGPLIDGTITRLLIDLNRSASNRRGLFGLVGRRLSEPDKTLLQDRYHQPYHAKVTAALEERINRGEGVTLLSIHSFTPVAKGVVRNADIGLLYDPARQSEVGFVHRLAAILSGQGVRVRRNYPYRGVSDGVATAMRRHFKNVAEGTLTAVEIEINQSLENTSLFQVGKRLIHGVRG